MVNYGTFEDLCSILDSDFERERILNKTMELNYGCNGIN